MNVISSFIADKYYPSQILMPYSRSQNMNENVKEDFINFPQEKEKEDLFNTSQ